MTEQKWLQGARLSEDLMSYLLRVEKVHRNKAGRRKLRLFGCGCCRLAWGLLNDRRLRAAVEVAERFADGKATKSELVAASASVARFEVRRFRRDPRDAAKQVATSIAVLTTTTWDRTGLIGQIPTALSGEGFRAGALTSEARMRDLVRCVFGNPFRPAAVSRVWLAWADGAVSRVAREIYEKGSFEQLPVLADALEDAGCDDGAILAHCRQKGPHVRGCWVVDLILGKQ